MICINGIPIWKSRFLFNTPILDKYFEIYRSEIIFTAYFNSPKCCCGCVGCSVDDCRCENPVQRRGYSNYFADSCRLRQRFVVELANCCRCANCVFAHRVSFSRFCRRRFRDWLFIRAKQQRIFIGISGCGWFDWLSFKNKSKSILAMAVCASRFNRFVFIRGNLAALLT